jgi:hypothetical protein
LSPVAKYSRESSGEHNPRLIAATAQPKPRRPDHANNRIGSESLPQSKVGASPEDQRMLAQAANAGIVAEEPTRGVALLRPASRSLPLAVSFCLRMRRLSLVSWTKGTHAARRLARESDGGWPPNFGRNTRPFTANSRLDCHGGGFADGPTRDRRRRNPSPTPSCPGRSWPKSLAVLGSIDTRW